MKPRRSEYDDKFYNYSAADIIPAFPLTEPSQGFEESKAESAPAVEDSIKPSERPETNTKTEVQRPKSSSSASKVSKLLKRSSKGRYSTESTDQFVRKDSKQLRENRLSTRLSADESAESLLNNIGKSFAFNSSTADISPSPETKNVESPYQMSETRAEYFSPQSTTELSSKGRSYSGKIGANFHKYSPPINTGTGELLSRDFHPHHPVHV